MNINEKIGFTNRKLNGEINYLVNNAVTIQDELKHIHMYFRIRGLTELTVTLNVNRQITKKKL